MNNLFGTRNYLVHFFEVHHELRAWRVSKITVFEYFQEQPNRFLIGASRVTGSREIKNQFIE
jgi:hypothetical protein